VATEREGRQRRSKSYSNGWSEPKATLRNDRRAGTRLRRDGGAYHGVRPSLGFFSLRDFQIHELGKDQCGQVRIAAFRIGLADQRILEAVDLVIEATDDVPERVGGIIDPCLGTS